MIGRQIFITDFGKELAISAQNIIDQVYAINYKTLAFRGQLSGRLKISVVSTGKYVISYFLTDFLKKHNGIELIMDVTNKAKVIDSLVQNEVDFSLVSVLPEHLMIDRIPLMRNKLYLVGNSDQDFNQQEYGNSILEELPMIYREQGSGTRQTMEQFISKHNVPGKKKMELSTNEAVKQAVMAGLGFSIMPIIGIKNELMNKVLQIIPVKGFPIESEWNLIWLKSKNHSPAASAYLEFLKSNKEQIIKEKFSWFGDLN